jgi:hypothetical protein
MIPYDDLVAALSSWRAKKGLPVVGAAPAAAPARTTPPVAPPRTNPPAPPQMRTNPPMPPPLAPDDDLDVEAAIHEGHYENEGDDFALSFGAGGAGATTEDETAIGGGPPERPSEGGQTDPSPAPGTSRKRNDDW